MTITAGWTVDEIREFVFEYERQPHGTKTKWRDAHGVSEGQLSRWRVTVYAGDLDRGLVPREGGDMVSVNRRRHEAMARTAGEAELKRLRARVEELEQANEALGAANDALGKAIGLLHTRNEHEPANTPPSSDRSSS